MNSSDPIYLDRVILPLDAVSEASIQSFPRVCDEQGQINGDSFVVLHVCLKCGGDDAESLDNGPGDAGLTLGVSGGGIAGGLDADGAVGATGDGGAEGDHAARVESLWTKFKAYLAGLVTGKAAEMSRVKCDPAEVQPFCNLTLDVGTAKEG